MGVDTCRFIFSIYFPSVYVMCLYKFIFSWLLVIVSFHIGCLGGIRVSHPQKHGFWVNFLINSYGSFILDISWRKNARLGGLPKWGSIFFRKLSIIDYTWPKFWVHTLAVSQKATSKTLIFWQVFWYFEKQEKFYVFFICYWTRYDYFQVFTRGSLMIFH